MAIGSEDFKSRILFCDVGNSKHYDSVASHRAQIPPFLADRHFLRHRPFTAGLWDVGSCSYGIALVGREPMDSISLAHSLGAGYFRGRYGDRYSTFHRGGT